MQLPQLIIDIRRIGSELHVVEPLWRISRRSAHEFDRMARPDIVKIRFSNMIRLQFVADD
jgi:hypothetical protein